MAAGAAAACYSNLIHKKLGIRTTTRRFANPYPKKPINIIAFERTRPAAIQTTAASHTRRRVKKSIPENARNANKLSAYSDDMNIDDGDTQKRTDDVKASFLSLAIDLVNLTQQH
ncbi:hypothetical protein HK100_012693 [Physocladia obscura]|uniref:Uncharacterized protein n=1 Tax=Physocladia obscura TaxID=109957 RepID=A0AAD5T1Z3_9FUNG|nr:hypothetical protein HK100_012693 [Physocladia obscura]